jgi:protein-tyrosine phosphatase
MAQGVLEAKLKERGLDWCVDSAGTSGWHDGEPPDGRAINACAKKGVDISSQRSRKLTTLDFDLFDVILPMDASNYQDVLRLCKHEQHEQKVKMFLNFRYPGRNMAVPDPYYTDRFDEVYDLLDSSMDSLIQSLQKETI